MTKIIVKFDNSLCSFIELSGHAGYAKSGYDIVCSGITVATYTSLNLIDKLSSDVLTLDVEEKSGYLRASLDYQNIDNDKIEMIQLIIKNMIDMYEEIKRDYPKYLKIEIK